MKYFLMILGVLLFIMAVAWDINAWIFYEDYLTKIPPSHIWEWELISIPFLLLGVYLFYRGFKAQKQPIKKK